MSNALDLAQARAAEAVCAGLHYTDFAFLGETNENGLTTWFMRGQVPHRIRVSVQRSRLAPFVYVVVEFYNRKLGKKGSILIQIDCAASQQQLEGGTTQAVSRCLEVYRDVLNEEGVAGGGAEVNSDATYTTNVSDEDDDGE